MDKKEEALKTFGTKYNWSQAVLNVFSEELGLEKEIALNLTKGFGGGAGRGELCGAVIAGIMALGIKHGENSKAYIDEFEEKIEEKYESIRCNKMLGYDVLDKESREKAENKNKKAEICPQIVADSILIVDKMMKNS